MKENAGISDAVHYECVSGIDFVVLETVDGGLGGMGKEEKERKEAGHLRRKMEEEGEKGFR
jgi:hypothetical protein